MDQDSNGLMVHKYIYHGTKLDDDDDDDDDDDEF